MLMQAYFGMPNRIAQGFLRLFSEKLGISSEFSYKTIERGYDPERTKKILDEVLKIMNESGNSEENVFSTDGTGDPSTMKVNYESRRSQQRIDKEKNRDMKSDAFPHTERESMTSSILHFQWEFTQRSSPDISRRTIIPLGSCPCFRT